MVGWFFGQRYFRIRSGGFQTPVFSLLRNGNWQATASAVTQSRKSGVIQVHYS
jgi:hypothetical protein